MSDFIFNNMILLERGTTAYIALTLENGDIQQGSNYLFEFENDITNQIVSIALNAQSTPTERFYAFGFIVNTYFGDNKNNGYWTYRLYENRTSPSIKRLIKTGKMKLIGDPFDFTQYNGQDNEFITYNS